MRFWDDDIEAMRPEARACVAAQADALRAPRTTTDHRLPRTSIASQRAGGRAGLVPRVPPTSGGVRPRDQRCAVPGVRAEWVAGARGLRPPARRRHGARHPGDERHRERRLAYRHGVVVVSVGYRTAPEHPHPAGIDDTVAVTTWLLEHGPDDFGTEELVLGGESAGAYLAVMTLLRLRNGGHDLRRIRGAKLSYGPYDWGRSGSNASRCGPRRRQPGLLQGVLPPRPHRRRATRPVDLAAVRRAARSRPRLRERRHRGPSPRRLARPRGALGRGRQRARAVRAPGPSPRVRGVPLRHHRRVPRPRSPHGSKLASVRSRQAMADAPVDRAQYALSRPPAERRTSCSSSSTTSASPSSAASGPTSRRRTSTAWRRTGCATTGSTSPRCARRRGRACSPAATTTRSAWASSPTSRSGYPGYNGRIPTIRGARCPGSCATRATTRSRSASGTSTPALGPQRAGPFDRWPLGFGFERYYGFLARRHEPVGAQPRARQRLRRAAAHARRGLPPHRGPGRPGDRDDRATSSRPRPTSRSSSTSRRARCTRRTTSPPEWIERYRGRFDDGWDAWRERAFARQLELGIVPAGTDAHRPARRGSPAGTTLPPTSGACTRRQMEVFAGFLTHTDHQIGRARRLPRTTRHPRRHDRHGRVRQRRERRGRRGRARSTSTAFALGRRTTIEGAIAAIDELGGVARVQPLLVGLGVGRQHAAAPLEALHVARRHPHPADRALAERHRGARRGAAQFCHAIDLVPTILDAAGIAAPAVVDGVDQQPVDGASLLPTFADADAAGPRDTQYFEMLGSRAIYARRLEGDHRPRLAGRARRGAAAAREVATSSRTAGRCSTSTPTSPRRTTSPKSTRASCGELEAAVVERSRSQPGVPPHRRSHRGRVSAMLPPPNPLPQTVVVPPRGCTGARRLGPADVRRRGDRGHRCRCRRKAPTACCARWATGRAASRSTSRTTASSTA